MARPYSLDLGERVVAQVARGMSRQAVAASTASCLKGHRWGYKMHAWRIAWPQIRIGLKPRGGISSSVYWSFGLGGSSATALHDLDNRNSARTSLCRRALYRWRCHDSSRMFVCSMVDFWPSELATDRIWPDRRHRNRSRSYLHGEWLNVAVGGAWAYSSLMPVLHFGNLSIGLSPVAQWILIPAISLLVVRYNKPSLTRDNQDERAASIRMRMRRGWADGGRAEPD